MIKRMDFRLDRAVRLMPVCGAADVSICSSGDFLLSVPSVAAEPRERAITLADSGKGVLSRSPKGFNSTVKITLPTVMASREEFHHQVDILFDIAEFTELLGA